MNKLHKIDSDLEYAIEFNGQININDILGVRAALYGENDEAEWYWVLKMKDGTWGLAQGGCDYTGWDCQSWLSFTPAKTVWDAIKLSPEKEDGYYSKRNVQQVLRNQVMGKQPFGSIDGKDYE